MQVKHVLLVEGCFNLLLMLIKIGVGLSTHSVALISDAMHSLSDFINNIVALVSNHVSKKEADDNHHYGHGNAEQLAVFTLAILLIVVAIEIVINAFRNQGELVVHSSIGLLFMVLVLCINLGLTAWQHFWAKRLHSDLLNADAKHTLSDVLTTVAAIAGWQFAANGLSWLDTIVAIIVAGLVLNFAVALLRKSVNFLMDHSDVSPRKIRHSVMGITDVVDVKNVRARMHHDRNFADLTIMINPLLTVSESHAVSKQVEALMFQRFNIDDVVVHIEPA